MRTIIVILFLVFPVTIAAQNAQMQSADMQKMMQKMQQCMAKVDQAELEKLEQDGKKFETTLKKLCKEGKRNKAQKMAITFSKQTKKNPALVQMKKCAEISKKMIPAGVMPEEEEKFDPSKGHVCDDIE